MDSATEAQPSVSTAVTISDDIQSTLAKHRGALEFAVEAYPVVETIEVANDCSRHLKNLKTAEGEVAAAKAELLDPVKAWIEKWISPTHRSIEAAVAHCDARLLEFSKREAERVARERREAEEADRKARAEAAAKAAAEEARAREAAEQRRKQAEEEDRKHREAVEAGNKRAAQQAAAVAAKLREEAAAKEEAGRQEAQRLQQEAAARAPTVVQEAPKVAGFHTRKNWKARLKSGVTEDQAIRLIATAMIGAGERSSFGQAIGERPEFVAMLKLDMSAANKKAKAEEANFNVPGLESWNDVGGASR